ncbi:MAG: protein kinase [Planctomycetota bacterium]|nr:protein kinase [Planctomycetota bacterium]
MEFSRETIDSSDQCPSGPEWQAFAVGRVEQQALQLMSSHLQACQQCLEVLDRISSKESKPHPNEPVSPFLLEENCIRLVEMLAGIQVQSESQREPANSDEDSSPLELPKTLGRFEIQGVLGTGGFGSVFLAYDPLLKRSVAIKAPKRTAFGTERDLENFLTEARHAAALDHPNIVPIYDIFEDATGHTLVVMKYVCGGPLSARHHQGKNALETIVRQMIVVAKAIHYAHERGFVHRDLKPSNILIDEHGQPHVTDLGLGMNLSDRSSTRILRGGTPPYMSPEQVRHDVLMIDRRSDIWAIGVVLSELVHGRRPFPQKNRDKLFHEIQIDEPLIESTRETYEIDGVIRRCLSKDPTDRYPTAESLANQLQDLHNRCFSTGLKKWLYGGRRKLVILTSLVVIAASFWGYLVLEKQSRIRLTFSQIKNASVSSLPYLFGKLRQLEPALETLATDLETPTTNTATFNRDLTLLVFGDRREETIERAVTFLKTADAGDINSIGQCIVDGPTKKIFEQVVVQRLDNANGSADPDSVLRFAALLSQLDPQNPILPTLCNGVSSTLVSMPQPQIQPWLSCFHHVGSKHLAKSLGEFALASTAPRERRLNATVALVRFFHTDTNFLCELICDLEEFQIPTVTLALRDRQTEALTSLKKLHRESQTGIPPSNQNDPAHPISMPVRVSNLAIATWLLGDYEIAFDSFQSSTDPTIQTLFVHKLSNLNVDSTTVIEILVSLQEKHDQRSSAIKFGLLQLLSLLHADEIPHPQLKSLLNYFWLNDTDCGVHSMARLNASKFDIELEAPAFVRNSTWLVDQIGEQYQDFAIIEPCIAELGMPTGQPPPLLTDPWPWHDRRFTRCIAIATNEVTIKQFRVFLPKYFVTDPMLTEADPDAAMAMVSMQAAYSFCNSWSVASGLQTCYEARSDEDGREKLYPKTNHLALNGYRLPTDGEWELACRSGTTTNRFYGDAEHLESQYGWVSETPGIQFHNGAYTSQPVARFLPNRWGLFDMYGNVKEICDRSCDPIQDSDELIEDEAISVPSPFGGPRIRGVSLDAPGELWGFSFCRTDRIVTEYDRLNGFRVVRTLLGE